MSDPGEGSDPWNKERAQELLEPQLEEAVGPYISWPHSHHK